MSYKNTKSKKLKQNIDSIEFNIYEYVVSIAKALLHVKTDMAIKMCFAKSWSYYFWWITRRYLQF